MRLYKDVTLPDDDDETADPRKVIPATLVARLQVAAQHDPLGIAIGLGFDTGLRAGEAAALRWIDVDLDTGVISINGSIKPRRGGWARGKTKNRKVRLVGISSEPRNWLALHRRIQVDTAALVGYPAPEYVLADPATGQGVTRNMPVQVLRRLLAAICTPDEYARYGTLRFHAIRHTHISTMLSKGANPADLAARVGHTIQTLLQCYAHAIPGADRQLTALSGELWPVVHSEATEQATLGAPSASIRGENFSFGEVSPDRSNPHTAAGRAALAVKLV